MSRRYLQLQSEAAIERAVTKAAQGLPVAPVDIAAAVAALSSDAVQAHDSGRTYSAPELLQRTENGHVSPARTFGRGTEADAYPVLDGAPVGCPESLEGSKRERAAASDALQWSYRNAMADSGRALTRAQRQNLKRAKRREKAAAHGPR